MEVDEKRKDCKVCFSAFDSNEKRPRCLPCGHTFCSKCVLDNLKNHILVCPSCRKEHKANKYRDFPVNYELESFLQDETSSQLRSCRPLGTPSDSLAPSSKSLCPPSESLCPPSEASRGISKKLKSMKEELSSGMEGIKASSQDVSSQLHQYKSQMMEWKEQHQKIMERLLAMVHQQERMIKHIDEESYRVGEAIKEGENERQRMKKAEDNLAAASTAHDVIPALEEADHCFDVLDNWNHKAQEQFPDIQLIIRSVMLREQTKSALKTLSTIEEEEEEEGKGEASALSANLCQQNLVDSSEDKTATAAAVAASFSTDSMLKIQEKVTKALEKVSEYIVATLTSNIQEKCIQAEVQQINQSIQTHLTSSVTVQDLKQMTPFVRQMLESGRVFAVRENEGEEGGMRCAKISLHQNRLCLHALTKDMSLPDDAFYLEHGDVMRLVDPSSRITFLVLGCSRGSTLGRLYIRLNGETKGAQQLSFLCTGEVGPSYAHTNILRVWDKGCDKEFVWGGDYERNDGGGGKVLVEGLMEEGKGEEYRRPWLAGTVCGAWSEGEAKAAQFLIFTRDNPRKVLVYCIGMVEEEGLSVLTEAISHYPRIKDVTIKDCGIVLPL